MDRPRLIRGQRIAWSVVWGILCLMLIALWVTSYWWRIGLSSGTYQGFYTYVGSNNGYVYYHRLLLAKPGVTTGWQWGVGWADRSHRTYTWQISPRQTTIIVPYPYFVPIVGPAFATLTIIPWLRWTFSLRTLLIATTLIAVVLGLVVWAAR